MAAPQSDIIIDANDGWSAASYLALLPDLKAAKVRLIEQFLPAGDDDLFLKGLDQLKATLGAEHVETNLAAADELGRIPKSHDRLVLGFWLGR